MEVLNQELYEFMKNGKKQKYLISISNVWLELNQDCENVIKCDRFKNSFKVITGKVFEVNGFQLGVHRNEQNKMVLTDLETGCSIFIKRTYKELCLYLENLLRKVKYDEFINSYLNDDYYCNPRDMYKTLGWSALKD